jgi:glyoxylase-like metal-dependent hydrolase (beta-lactamase superfamily II)
MPNLPSGLHVIERGWLSANMVIATGQYNSAVIDSGYCTHADQTVALVFAALNDSPLDLLLNTHLHSDHCGGNFALQKTYRELQTLIPPGQAKFVTDWDPFELTHQPTGQLCPQFIHQGLLTPNTEILLGNSAWQIHAAAGHDPHSVILFEPLSKTLISADALWENGFGVVFPELEGQDAFAAVGATLDLIETLGPVTIIPGHGRIFEYTEEVQQRAKQRLAAFTADPVKHARHGVKVLLKFKLLEVQSQELNEFKAWALKTSYFETIRFLFFRELSLNDMIEQLVGELVHSGVAQRDGGRIHNL